MQNPVCPGRDNVLLGKPVDGVGKRMEQPYCPHAKDAGAIGPDSVLDEGRLLAFYPGMQPCQVHDPEEHDERHGQLDGQVGHHGAATPGAFGPPSRDLSAVASEAEAEALWPIPAKAMAEAGRSNAAPWEPMVS